MCSPITCRTCGKVSWTGCGQHVDQVMANVPEDRRCRCGEGDPSEAFFAKLFGGAI